MLELVTFGLTGLVAILLVAFYFACKDHATLFSDKLSPSLMCDAELRPPKPCQCCGIAKYKLPCIRCAARERATNPCYNTANFVDPTNDFGTQRRNQLRGPGYFDTDFDVEKSFAMPSLWASALEIMRLTRGARTPGRPSPWSLHPPGSAAGA
jgi:hypothetical protein